MSKLFTADRVNLTIKECAERLALGENLTRDLIKARHIKSMRFGNKDLVLNTEINRFLVELHSHKRAYTYRGANGEELLTVYPDNRVELQRKTAMTPAMAGY